MGFLHSCIFTKHVWVQLVEQKHDKHEKWLALYSEVHICVCMYISLFKSRSCTAASVTSGSPESFFEAILESTSTVREVLAWLVMLSASVSSGLTTVQTRS